MAPSRRASCGVERSIWLVQTVLFNRVPEEVAERPTQNLDPGERVVIRRLEKTKGEGGRQGYSPLEPAGKRPLGGLGLRQATRDPERIGEWWGRWPDANVGLRCDGLCVLDVDRPAGERSLAELRFRLGELPETRSQRSGRGRHLL
jgi:Bifunctional DNA primase/polymerase, N-terminal